MLNASAFHEIIGWIGIRKRIKFTDIIVAIRCQSHGN